ncbi:hypothetical protein CFOL_v3_28902 [Cephalotus follicularis]|uniref:Uncharacterized protein n=1 Tax=Cephalotus follicularis TaxID=3775 RepID=A0A1Q3CYZ5_CEPFO|nr:hypothetical protein CFOL_v3_28902 [Cephalotus follicularis]
MDSAFTFVACMASVNTFCEDKWRESMFGGTHKVEELLMWIAKNKSVKPWGLSLGVWGVTKEITMFLHSDTFSRGYQNELISLRIVGLDLYQDHMVSHARSLEITVQ